MDELRCLAAVDNFDIIVINKAFIATKNIDPIDEYIIEGYSSSNKLRLNRGGRGIALYVNTRMNLVQRHASNNNLELLSGEIYADGSKVNISVIYRPRGLRADLDKEMYYSPQRVIHPNETVILDDLNLPHIDWQTLNVDESRLHKFLKIF